MTKPHVPTEPVGTGDPLAVASPSPWLAPSVWTAWVKPALLWDRVTEPAPPAAEPAEPVTPVVFPSAAFGTAPQAAIVVDVNGALAVRVGAALALRGHRPVLSINTTTAVGERIDMRAVSAGLVALARCARPTPDRVDAPPAFLLDARRASPPAYTRDCYDNVWAIFASDLPSAEALRARGITEVVVVQETETPLDDLYEVLLRWREEGLPLSVVHVETLLTDPAAAPVPLVLQRRSLGARVFHWLRWVPTRPAMGAPYGYRLGGG